MGESPRERRFSPESGSTRGCASRIVQSDVEVSVAKLGFIGLGIMGKPMAGHLIAAGHEVFLNSRSGVPQELKD